MSGSGWVRADALVWFNEGCEERRVLHWQLSMLQYHAAYHRIEDGWYLAEVLDFPGVVTQGRTLRSARRMARDALRLMAETLVEEGEPLPKPNPRKKAKRAAFQEKIPLKLRFQCGSVP